ncbi:ESPR-type extended signal peptide-containing protein [Veillonella atypica]|nr:ESPR-type extended signal peptide-containing protein [Veillonella atypica]
MNKIFKVVWSKTKECYVVVSEVAKNNGGKKKVLASVLAGLAMVGAGATVTSVQAADMNSDQSANTKNQINIWANTLTKGNPAAGGSGASGSGVANANDVKPSQYGDEISIAIGGQNSINTTDTTSPNSGGSGYAIGNKNKIKGNRNVALGTENKTYGDDSIAIGNKTVSGTGHGIAIGSINGTTQTVAYGSANPSETAQSAFGFALAIGSGAQADGRANGASGGIAIGQMVKSTNNNTVAIGVNTTASGNNAVAIGSGAQATQRISTAYGPNANANSAGGVAIGTDAVVGTDTGLTTVIAGATAVGANAQAQSTSGSAFGRNAKADKNAENATALGAYATANIAGGVALGSNSVTTTAAGVPGYNPANGRTNKYSDQSGAIGTSTLAAVSVGNGLTATRQITGLAAGTADTDAVNVAQLKNVNLKYAGDSTQVTGSTDVRLNDGTFNVNGDGTIISTEATATGIKVTAKVGGTINANTDGKVVAPATNGIATTTNVTDAINKSGWNIVSSNNGGSVTGTQATKLVNPGSTVTLSAGKNIVLDQNDKKFTYSLSDTVALTNAGSLTVGDTKVNNGGVTITAPTGGTTTDVKLTNTGLDNGGNKIVNVKDGDVSATSKDAVNGSQLHAVAAKERHIAPTTATHAAYTVDNNGDVTLDYVDGDGAATSEKAVIKGVAKQDLSNITNAGKQVITGLSNKVVAGDNITVDETEDATTKQKTYKVNAKLAKLEDGTNTTVTGDGTTGNAYHVNVAGDLTGISSITNGGTNNGKISFGPNKTVTVDGDHSITLNASTGTIGGLQNKTFDPTNITSGQAATEDQLKSVHDTLKASELHIAPTASTLTNEHLGGTASGNTATGAAAQAYKYDATTKQVVLEYNDGNGTNKTGTKAVIDFSALNTGTGASSWNIASDKVSTTEGTVAAGSGATQNIADGKTVTMKAGKNLTVKQENVGGNASVAFSLDKDLKDLDSVTTNKTITKEITLKDPNGGTTSTTIKKDGDRITYTNDGSTTVNKVANLADEKHITPGTYSVDSNGKVTMTYTDGNNTLVPNTTTVIDGLVTKKLDNIDNDGKKTITGLGTIVKAGNNVTVSEASDATTGQKTYTVNAVTPAVYTKADGTKVVKRSDGTYTTNIDGSAGNDVPASDVIISFQDAAGDTKNATSIVNNVGSAIKNQTGGDFLTKLDNANTATPNAAVNVSDLKNTADGLTNKGLKFDANSGGVKTNKLGSTVKVQGAGTSADANYSGANIKTFIDQDTTGNTTIDVKLDKNLTGINSISNTTTGPKMEFGGNSINITGGSLNMGGSNITNLKSGIVNNNATDDTNAANIGDVKKIAKDSDLHIAPTAGTTNNVAEYTVDANNKVTLTYQDGNGTAVTAPKAVIDLSALANKITSGYTFNANATANGGTVANDSTTPAAVTAVANGGTINYAAGKNLTVKQDIDTTNKTHTYTYSLDKDINVETVTVTGQNGKDGKIGINGKNGTNGVNGTNRVDIQVEKGVDGIDGKNGTDGISRIVYEDKTGTHTVATMDDGLKFTGNNESTENKHKLGSLVKVQGEGVTENTTTNKLEANGEEFKSASGNIAVVADSIDKLTVKLNKNLAGINKISNGGSSITLNDNPSTTTPAVTITGGNLSMGDNTTKNKIVNLAPGTDDNDAVNVKQLKDAKTVLADGKNTKKSGTGTATDPYKVNVEGDLTDITSITNKADASGNAGKITFSPNQTVTVDGDHSITLNASTGKIGGLQNKTFDPTNFTSGQAATEDQLKSVHDTLKASERHIAPTTVATGSTETKGGTANAAGTANVYKYDAASKTVTLTYNDGNGNAVTDTKAVIDLSNLSTGGTGASSWNVKSSANTTDGGAVDANHNANAQNIADGKSVEFQSGKNLVVKQTNDTTNGNATVEFSLSDNITVGKDGANGKDGSVGAKGADGSAVVMNGKDGSIGSQWYKRC